MLYADLKNMRLTYRYSVGAYDVYESHLDSAGGSWMGIRDKDLMYFRGEFDVPGPETLSVYIGMPGLFYGNRDTNYRYILYTAKQLANLSISLEPAIDEEYLTRYLDGIV